MTERIMVDNEGIWTSYRAGTLCYPWPEVDTIAVYAWLLPPHGERVVGMDVSHVSGDFLDIDEQAEGFHAAVHAISARAGHEAPDLSNLRVTDGPVEIWRALTA